MSFCHQECAVVAFVVIAHNNTTMCCYGTDVETTYNLSAKGVRRIVLFQHTHTSLGLKRRSVVSAAAFAVAQLFTPYRSIIRPLTQPRPGQLMCLADNGGPGALVDQTMWKIRLEARYDRNHDSLAHG